MNPFHFSCEAQTNGLTKSLKSISILQETHSQSVTVGIGGTPQHRFFFLWFYGFVNRYFLRKHLLIFNMKPWKPWFSLPYISGTVHICKWFKNTIVLDGQTMWDYFLMLKSAFVMDHVPKICASIPTMWCWNPKFSQSSNLMVNSIFEGKHKNFSWNHNFCNFLPRFLGLCSLQAISGPLVPPMQCFATPNRRPKKVTGRPRRDLGGLPFFLWWINGSKNIFLVDILMG